MRQKAGHKRDRNGLERGTKWLRNETESSSEIRINSETTWETERKAPQKQGKKA